MPLVREWLLIVGHSPDHARTTVENCGRSSLLVLQRASEAGCAHMPADEAFRVFSSALPPTSFAQDDPDGYITFGVPGEIPVKVARSALREEFFHRLLSREVMLT